MHRFARAQNYYSAFEEYCKMLEPEEINESDAIASNELLSSKEGEIVARSLTASQSKEHDILKYDFGEGDDNTISSSKYNNELVRTLISKADDILSEHDLEPEHEVSASRMLAESEGGYSGKRSMRSTWISHRSHRKENVPVDHIFYLNPSEQVEKRLPPIPDWTNLVYREIFLRMTENQEIRSIQDIFETFDTANKSFITLEEFKNALVTLGEKNYDRIEVHLYLCIPHIVFMMI